MKWFGEPWPRPDFRAPVCEDDDDRMDVPVGEPCLRCERGITADDRGVAMPFVIGGLRGLDMREAYYHAQCFLAEVVGDAAAAEIAKRMEAQS